MKKASTIVKVSPKYQIAIPAAVRQQADIRPGAEFEILITEIGLRLVPVRPLSQLRGSVRLHKTTPLREKTDRY